MKAADIAISAIRLSCSTSLSAGSGVISGSLCHFATVDGAVSFWRHYSDTEKTVAANMTIDSYFAALLFVERAKFSTLLQPSRHVAKLIYQVRERLL